MAVIKSKQSAIQKGQSAIAILEISLICGLLRFCFKAMKQLQNKDSMEQTSITITDLTELAAVLIQVHIILSSLQQSQRWQDAVKNPDSHHEMDSDIENAKHYIKMAMTRYSETVDGCYIA
jgi:hypothetical protein